METPFLRATLQVVIGGALVFATGIWIGSPEFYRFEVFLVDLKVHSAIAEP